MCGIMASWRVSLFIGYDFADLVAVSNCQLLSTDTASDRVSTTGIDGHLRPIQWKRRKQTFSTMSSISERSRRP